MANGACRHLAAVARDGASDCPLTSFVTQAIAHAYIGSLRQPTRAVESSTSKYDSLFSMVNKHAEVSTLFARPQSASSPTGTIAARGWCI